MKKDIIKELKNNPSLFNMTPSDNAWGNIEKNLDRHKKQRRIIMFTSILSAVAAILVGVMIIPNYVNNEVKIDFHASYDSTKQIEELTPSSKDIYFNNLIAFNKSMKMKERYSKVSY